MRCGKDKNATHKNAEPRILGTWQSHIGSEQAPMPLTPLAAIADARK